MPWLFAWQAWIGTETRLKVQCKWRDANMPTDPLYPWSLSIEGVRIPIKGLKKHVGYHTAENCATWVANSSQPQNMSFPSAVKNLAYFVRNSEGWVSLGTKRSSNSLTTYRTVAWRFFSSIVYHASPSWHRAFGKVVGCLGASWVIIFR